MEKDKIISSLSFHKSTKVSFLKDEQEGEEYPLVWKKIFFKTYPRFKKIKLLNSKLPKKNFQTVIKNRISTREFKSKPITLKKISQVLKYSIAIIKKPKKNLFDETRRMYPSAGARYPLEFYIVILNSKEIFPGLYHYNVKLHCLELLIKGNLRDFFYKALKQNMIKKANFLIITSSIFSRTKIKYGERSYRYILMEAGHATQNFYLVASCLKMGCCAIGGFIDNKINKLLDFVNDEEAVLYITAFGEKYEK